MSALRIGVIGCGAVSEIYHLPAIARSPALTLGAVVDADAQRVATIARRYRARACLADYRRLPGTIDAAIIATPNATHAEIACFLLERGIHVLCEKPLATTLADGERMIAASERGAVRLMVGHIRRFNPNAALIRELVVGGHLGTIEKITAALGGRYGSWPHRTDFRRQSALSGGGVLLDLGIHLIDTAVSLAGEDVRVASYHATDTLGWGVENDAEVVLTLQHGGRAVLSCSYTHGLDRTLRVEGTDGWAHTSVDGAPEVTFSSKRARVCARAGAQRLLVPEVDPFRAQLDHFVDCIVRNDACLVPLAEVLAGLRVIDHCYAVARAA
jgi:predicted dehydrogenase